MGLRMTSIVGYSPTFGEGVFSEVAPEGLRQESRACYCSIRDIGDRPSYGGVEAVNHVPPIDGRLLPKSVGSQ
jgi:hypothetical protein